MDLAAQIESYLFAEPRWVPVAEICARFQIDERCLRADRRRRPLHAHFAISSSTPGASGLKHIQHATTREKIVAKHAPRKRLVAAIRAERDYNTALANAISGKWPNARIDGHGNGVLPL